MEIIEFANEYKKPIVLALGFFDCIHLGHMALIKRTTELSEKFGCDSAILTFKNNPYKLLQKSGDNPIFTFEERVDILRETNLNLVIAAKFDETFMQLSKIEFIELLLNCCCIKAIVCGYDYKFGKNADGDVDFLSKTCEKHSVMCDIISPVCDNSLRISTTIIRSFLFDGHVEKANELLGRRYFLSGKVCHGRSVGKTFEFPTANLEMPNNKMLPCESTYATVTTVRGKKYKSVTNVGGKPTFGENDSTVETMLADFCEDIYGEELKIEFVRKLRPIRKFDSPYDLKEQIYKDIQWR